VIGEESHTCGGGPGRCAGEAGVVKAARDVAGVVGAAQDAVGATGSARGAAGVIEATRGRKPGGITGATRRVGVEAEVATRGVVRGATPGGVDSGVVRSDLQGGECLWVGP
jgi:hypothetical protein